MFIFKRSTVIVDMFIDDPMIAETTPALPANRFFPQWIKDMPVEKTQPVVIQSGSQQIIQPRPTLTIKGCSGVHNYFSHGIIIPLWTDLSMSVYPDGRFSYVNPEGEFKVESHWPGQWEGFEGYAHMKYVVPWLAKEKTGINFLVQKPVWTVNNNPIWISKMVGAGGITNLRDQHSVHLNIMHEIPAQRQDFFLKLGTPLVHLIPLTEKKVQVKTHVVSKKELTDMWNSTGVKSFTHAMKKRLQITKALKDTSKCPFKF